MQRHKLDSKFNKNVILSEIKTEINDEINQEIEDLQIQVNTLRKDMTNMKKRKTQSQLATAHQQNIMSQNQFTEFSFDQENSENFELSVGDFGTSPDATGLTRKAPPTAHGITSVQIESLKADLKSHQIEIEQLQRAISQKANIKDVCALVDRKSNTADVFKVFEEIKRSVELLASRQ